jgi:CDP-4-dehydro-6-deoxyglucose reductase
MFNITLKNGKKIRCDNKTTIFDAAKSSGIFLEHSCLKARCRSCIVKVTEGTTKDILEDLVLTQEEKKYYTLSCNAIPTSNISINIEDLENIVLHEKKIVPAKIQSIEKINPNVIKVLLRLPPKSSLSYNSGQYINLTRGSTKRSYSIANKFQEDSLLELLIKKYQYGLLSKYWFDEAKENDLLRLEGPLGSFFLRNTNKKNIIFLATGTGIAPIKAMLEYASENHVNYENKTFWLFFGTRYREDIFWEPLNFSSIRLNYTIVLSKETIPFNGFKGYVQNAVLASKIDLSDAQIYASGSLEMIQSAKRTLINGELKECDFFSDAFVPTN